MKKKKKQESHQILCNNTINSLISLDFNMTVLKLMPSLSKLILFDVVLCYTLKTTSPN